MLGCFHKSHVQKTPPRAIAEETWAVGGDHCLLCINDHKATTLSSQQRTRTRNHVFTALKKSKALTKGYRCLKSLHAHGMQCPEAQLNLLTSAQSTDCVMASRILMHISCRYVPRLLHGVNAPRNRWTRNDETPEAHAIEKSICSGQLCALSACVQGHLREAAWEAWTLLCQLRSCLVGRYCYRSGHLIKDLESMFEN